MDWMILAALLAGFITGGSLVGLYFMRQLSDKRQQYLTEEQLLHIQIAQQQKDISHLTEQLNEARSREALLSEKLDSLSQNISREKEALIEEKTAIETELDTLKQHYYELDEKWHKQFEAFMLKSVETARSTFEENLTKTSKEKEERFQKEIKNTVEPLQEMVEKFGKRTIALDDRIEQLALAKNQLISALTHNKGRGDWGEVELIRLLEDSGLQEGYHFTTQETVGIGKRPDVCLQLPDKRVIFIDAKTLQFDINDVSVADDPTEEAKRQERCVHSLKQAVKNLSRKSYQDELTEAANFVVLYVPREWMYSLALQKDPNLFREAYDNNILLAGPLNLLGLCLIVKQGWFQAELSDNAEEILKIGKELHKRAALFSMRFNKIGQSLERMQSEYIDVKNAFDGQKGFTKQFKKLEALGCQSAKSLPDEILTPENRLTSAIDSE